MEGVSGALFGDKRAQLNTPSRWAGAHKGANSAHRHFHRTPTKQNPSASNSCGVAYKETCFDEVILGALGTRNL